MKEIIGCYGLVCSDCQIYEATQNDDLDLRSTVYKRQIEWGHGDRFQQLFGRDYMPEDIRCDGCPFESGRAFWYIENCQMRACCLGRNHENCAHCVEYPCEKLQSFFDKSHVNARKTLDDIRSRI